MTRGQQIIEEVKRIIAEAHKKSDNDPMADMVVTLSFTLGARWADKHPHGISVEDELPPIGGIVLVASPLGGELSVLPLSIKNESDFECLSGMTHWMPLPLPPKKGGNQ